jgi:GTP cyclohydrolase I
MPDANYPANLHEAIKNYKPSPLDGEAAVRLLIELAGDDPERPDLLETPARVLRAMKEMLNGYMVNIPALFKTFKGEYDQMVVVKDIDFVSFCEHHLLPFEGVAHVAYVPKGEVIGLSKIARVVDAYAKQLQIQERLTQQVTVAFAECLPTCLGAACIIEAHHSCMGCRGVKKPNAKLITSSVTGVFLNKPEVRAELFSLLGLS